MIPTAKDFWNNACKNDELKSPADIMIDFAKLHVEAALKEASENVKCDVIQNTGFVDKYSILDAYPLNKIK